MDLFRRITTSCGLEAVFYLLSWCSLAACYMKLGVYEQPTVRILPADGRKEINLRENSDIVLTCAVTGHPTPKIQWSITGGELGRRPFDLSSPVLRISSIKRTESSRVNCRAENRFGSIATTTRLNVLYLDQPTMRLYITKSDPIPNDSIWYENTVILRCETRSNPAPEITWYKSGRLIKLALAVADGYEIRPLTRYSRDGTTYILKIRNASAKNYGKYECKASLGIYGRRFNIPDLTANFTFDSQASEPKLELLSPAVIYANPEDAVRLECRVVSGWPQPAVAWIRENDAVSRTSVIGKKRKTLDLVDVRRSDAGAYFCVANNNVGNPVKKQVSLVVRFLEPMQYWITPDPLQDNRRLAVNMDAKLTCYTNAQPAKELVYTWFKKNHVGNNIPFNPRNMRPNIIIRDLKEAEVKKFITFPAFSSRLEIQKMQASDMGVYVCEARLVGAPNGTQVRAAITVMRESAPAMIYPANGNSVVTFQEGSRAVLDCRTDGHPKPQIIWLRDGNTTAPTDNRKVITKGGSYLIPNVSRDDADTYTCMPARVNGFSKLAKSNSKAEIDLVVNYPPEVEPKYLVVRRALGADITLMCIAKDAQPFGNFKYKWTKSGHVVSDSDTDKPVIISLQALGDYGVYICELSNQVGTSRCVINVTGAAYAPEFFYRPEDTLQIRSTASSLFPQRSSPDGVFLFLLSWTQKYPTAVDSITQYRIRWRKLSNSGSARNLPTPTPWHEGCMDIEGAVEYGKLISYELRDLSSGSYEAAVTPINIFGEGDTAYRIIDARKKRGPQPTLLGPSYFCSFDDVEMCSFMQEPSTRTKAKSDLIPSDEFDWTWNNARNLVRRTQDTGPEYDNTNMAKDGGYMYIESSNTKKGDKARLVSPTFWDANSKYQCLKFFYHMKGAHIGTLRLLMRAEGKKETELWTRSRAQGDDWLSDSITLSSPSSYQIIFEAEILESNGYMGDIAIDDVLLTYGLCPTASATTLAALRIKSSSPGNGAMGLYSPIFGWFLNFNVGDVVANFSTFAPNNLSNLKPSWQNFLRHLQADISFLAIHFVINKILLSTR